MTTNDRSEAEREQARLRREQARSGKKPPPSTAKAEPPEPPIQAPPVLQHRETPAPEEQGSMPNRPVTKPVRRSGGAPRWFAVGGLALVVFMIWMLFSYYQPFKGKGQGTVSLTIVKGMQVDQIAAQLSNRGVVGNKFFFGLRVRNSGVADQLKAGRYDFHNDMSYASAIQLMKSGPNAATTTITVPEGRSRYEISSQTKALGLSGDYMVASKQSPKFKAARYAAQKAASLEGFLFPATYELAAGANVNRLVNQQLRAFDQNFGSVNMSYARSKNLTPYDVVTVASLIEREVQVASERKLVAAVIYNRLRLGIPLGIDATTRFSTRNWTQPLTNSDFQERSPYNTRLNKGLPPGPIGNPGLASLKAAARPASVGYLYYVANPCKPGSHTFAKTDAEFQQAVERYNQARAAAGGRQPKGC